MLPQPLAIDLQQVELHTCCTMANKSETTVDLTCVPFETQYFQINYTKSNVKLLIDFCIITKTSVNIITFKMLTYNSDKMKYYVIFKKKKKIQPPTQNFHQQNNIMRVDDT